MEYFRILLVLNIALASSVTHGALIRRFNYEARLYEQFELDSRYIQFSRTEPDAWNNLPTLAQSRNFSHVSMICTSGPGAWLFYPDDNFQLGNSQTYYIVIGEACVRSDDIESIQPLGKMDEVLDNGVLLFEKPQFGSKATLIEGEGSGSGGSLIFTGLQSYQISGGSDKYCLVSGMSSVISDGIGGGYCLIPDLKASLGIDGTVNVKQGCSNDEGEQKIIAQHCYQPGIHEIYSDTDFSIDKLTEVCDGGGSDFLKSKFSILMDMWGKRVGKDVERQPTNYRDDQQAKLKVIWTVFEIFKTKCNLVDDLYVYLLGQLFVLHLRDAWKSQAVNLTSTEATTLNFATGFFEYCLETVEAEGESTGPSSDEIEDITEKICGTGEAQTGDESFTSSWSEIANGHAFDSVIEGAWLIVNYVIPKCSGYMEYITNDWSDLVLLFNSAFFDPLQDLWVDSGDWERIYDAVFHGYDLREEHYSLLTCLEESLRSSPSYDPIGRPKSFNNVVIRKNLIPKELQIQPGKQRKRSVNLNEY